MTGQSAAGNKTTYTVIAVVVMAVWSVAFVSVKVLLNTLTPVEIMFDRFVLTYAALWLVHPKFHKPVSLKDELMVVGAGVFGGTAYYLAQDYALTYTSATNACLLISMEPLLTAILAHFLTKNEKIKPALLLGSLVAFTGCFLVIFNGTFRLELHLAGDLLAVGAAVCWAVYSIFVKKIDSTQNGIAVTRRIFLYSILTSLPVLPLFGYRFALAPLLAPPVLLNLLFLALISSGVCIVLWNRAIWVLGAVQTSNILYFSPALTLIASALLLGEGVTAWAVGGMALILGGLYVAENAGRRRAALSAGSGG